MNKRASLKWHWFLDSSRFVFPLVFIYTLILAGCAGTPGTAGQPDQAPTSTLSPEETQLEPTAITTEEGILQASPSVPQPGTSTATPTVPEQPSGITLPTEASYLPLPPLTSGQQVKISYIDMIDAANGWAIGGDQDPGDRLLRTRDGGQTWRDVGPAYLSPDKNAPGKIKNAFFLDPNSAWVAVYYLPQSDLQDSDPASSRIWRTLDGGLSWEVSEPIELFIMLFGSEDSEVIDPSPPPLMQFLDADHGWILIRDTGSGMHRYPVSLYRTSDGGLRWKNLFDAYGDVIQGGYKTGMTFADAQTGWVTTESYPVGEPFVRASSDGGSEWEEIWLPPPDFDPGLDDSGFCVDQYSPHLFSATHGVLVVDCFTAEDSGQTEDILYTTEDGGGNWRSDPYPGGALQMLDPQLGWALSRDIFQTRDGGRTWEKLKTVNWDGQFDFVDQNTGFAVARSNGQIALVHTTDAGRSWEMLEPVLAP